MELFFQLMTVPDKQLRAMVYSHVVNDIKALNKGGKNEKVNRKLQAFMHKLLAGTNSDNGGKNKASAINTQDSQAAQAGSATIKDSSSAAARKCIDIACELYRQNIWTDVHTVNMIATATLSSHSPIMVRAIHFFLGIEDRMSDDKEKEEVS